MSNLRDKEIIKFTKTILIKSTEIWLFEAKIRLKLS